MIRTTFLFLGTYLFAALALFQTAHALEAPEIDSFTLENGLQVIVIPNESTEAISHNLLFRFGAADDPHGKSGLAHYLEHMMFQGSKNLAPNEYSRKIAAHGGQSNAFTSQDYTGYWANITREYLPLVMELEAERLQHMQPPVEDFNRERQVILEERRSRIDNNPIALFQEQLRALLYYHHPYGTPIIGWPEEMSTLSREDVLEYYHAVYHPANAVLVVAGNVTTDEVRNLVDEHYAPLEARTEKPAPRTKEPQQLGPRRFEMSHDKAGHAFWERRYLTPSYGWPALADGTTKADREAEILALTLAEYLLGGSKTSRLYQRLVDQDTLASEVSVSYYPFHLGPAEFAVRVQPVDAAKLPDIERIIEEEMQRLITEPPTDREMQRSKIQQIASNTYLRDGLQPLARVIGHLQMLNLPLDFYYQWEENVKAVTAEQVSQSLKLLDDNYSVTGTLLPE